jgi:hypothetical protein
MTHPNVGRILDFWEAYDRVNALPDSWHETATICQQLALMVASQAASAGIETELQPYKDFMPPRWVPPPARTKERVVTDDEVASQLDRVFKAGNDD